MKAIVLRKYGGSDKLELSDQPEPHARAGEIKVRLASASINPIDWKLRSGQLKSVMPLQFPVILGRDAAGEVVEVGAGVTAFHLGDRVMGLINQAYAEFVVAPVAAWAKLPSGLDAENAGALPLVLLTGDQLVVATLGSGSAAGLRVLVTGALGAVGRVAGWVAKQRGAEVIAGMRSKQLAQAKELGLDGALALDDDAAIADFPPVDRIADTIGGATIAKLYSKLNAGGVIGSVVGDPPGAKERGVSTNSMHAHPDSARLAELGGAVARGELVIPIAKRFPLAQANAAHDFAQAGGVGKVLLIP
jgi:NADPH:quinone reductase-like Zn-dependent oxidoreductase